jgi:hypothetical protein
MAYLGDFLGQLVSEVTRARMQADIEAIRVAEVYASHHLLRHMPIPHFRMPDVELDVPVVLQDLDGDPADGRKQPSVDAVMKKFQGALDTTLREANVTLKPEQKKRVQAAVQKQLPSLMGPSEISADMMAVADGAARIAIEILAAARGPVTAEQRKLVEKKLRDASRMEFLKLRGSPPRLRASVKTADVREAGPGEVVTRVRLKISEEAIEWTSIDDDGETPNRLVME